MMSVGLIAGVVILEARPVYAYLMAQSFGTPISPSEMVIGFGLAGALCLGATMLPLTTALTRLERTEL